MTVDEHLLYPPCRAALIHIGALQPGAWTHCTRCNARGHTGCTDMEAQKAQIEEGKSE